MINKEQKKQTIKDLTEKFSNHIGVVFFNYSGMDVSQFRELRIKLRENEMECRIARKTLIDLALKEAGYENIKATDLNGQLALVFGYEDEISPAKTVYDFAKQNESVEILAGMARGEYLDSDKVVSLAKLPSRDELAAKLVGQMKAPLAGLVNTLEGNLRKLVFVLRAASEVK